MSAPRVVPARVPGAGAPPPNTRGWRAPWRRTWGPFTDGRSRLARLAAKIEGELRETYHTETAFERRRLRLAARYLALAEKTLGSMDVDPKATRRAATALQKVAEMQLAGLRAAVSASPEATFAARVRGNGHGGG